MSVVKTSPMKTSTPLKLTHKIQLFCMRLFAKGVRAIGFKATYSIANFFGLLAWHFSKGRRTLAITNIQSHLNVSLERATQIAKASFSANFCSFSELLLTQNFGCDEIGKRLIMANPKNWEDFQVCDRPIVGTTGHFGAWEFFSSMTGEIIPSDRPRTIVARSYPNPAVQQFVREQREARGANMVGHRSVVASVLKSLRQKGMVGFLVDHRPRKSESIMLPFLGQETAINFGPALLAIRAEAVIWPSFLNREKNGTYHFHLYDPLDTKDVIGTHEERITAVALFYTQAMEKHIRAYPEQWFWMHDRWKEAT